MKLITKHLTTWGVISILIWVVACISVMTSQGNKPDITLKELPELQSIKIQNLYLKADNLQYQIQSYVDERNRVMTHDLPELIGKIQQDKDLSTRLEGYEFDYTSATFKYKK